MAICGVQSGLARASIERTWTEVRRMSCDLTEWRYTTSAIRTLRVESGQFILRCLLLTSTARIRLSDRSRCRFPQRENRTSSVFTLSPNPLPYIAEQCKHAKPQAGSDFRGQIIGSDARIGDSFFTRPGWPVWS